MRSVVAWIAVVGLLCAASTRAETIRVSGTGSGVGTLRLLANAFERTQPQHRVEVLPALGSTGGIKALRAGQLQLAVSNRDVSGDERSAGLSARLYATTPLAIVTHGDVPATTMTRDRLAQILVGKDARWSNGRAIRIVLRPLSDGDSKLVAGLSPAVAEAWRQAHERPGMMLAQTDSDAADYVERTPMALGMVTLAQIASEQRRLNALSLDGVPATPAALEAGRYPLSKDLYLVMRNDASEAVRSFAAFVTSNADAAVILRRNGHISR